MTTSTLRRAVAVAVAAAAMTPAGAMAANATTPCNGLLKADPAGDNTTYLVGNDIGAPSDANGDLTGLFINRTGDLTTVNFTVATLDKNVPPGAEGLVYRYFYDVSGVTYYLEAGVSVTGGDPYFEYGTFDTSFTKDGDATGQWIDGQNGVVQWEIPADHGGKAGVKFTNMYGWASYGRGAILTPTDYIPDGGEGGTRLSYNGAQCPADTPPPTPGPPVTGGSGTSTNPNPGQPAAARGPLVVSVRPTTFKAAKVKRVRKLAVELETKEQLKHVKLTLKKGTKAVGTGRLASLTNISKATLKLKRRGLAKGRYALLVTATRADGSTGKVTLKLRVR